MWPAQGCPNVSRNGLLAADFHFSQAGDTPECCLKANTSQLSSGTSRIMCGFTLFGLQTHQCLVDNIGQAWQHIIGSELLFFKCTDTRWCLKRPGVLSKPLVPSENWYCSIMTRFVFVIRFIRTSPLFIDSTLEACMHTHKHTHIHTLRIDWLYILYMLPKFGFFCELLPQVGSTWL